MYPTDEKNQASLGSELAALAHYRGNLQSEKNCQKARVNFGHEKHNFHQDLQLSVPMNSYKESLFNVDTYVIIMTPAIQWA